MSKNTPFDQETPAADMVVPLMEPIEHNFFDDTPKASVEYNPDLEPANIDMAQKHGKAKRIYRFNEGKKPKGKLCPCCGLPESGGELIPLTCDPSELYHIGSGYVLYFIFFKHCIGMLLTMLFVSGIYNMYTNLTNLNCVDPATIDPNETDLDKFCCTRGIFADMSLASKKDNASDMAIQVQLNLLTVIALIVYFQSVRYKMRKINEEVAESKTTPADYTLMFSEMPVDPNHELSSDEGLKKWLEDLATPENPVQVKKINRAYNVIEFKKCMDKKEKVEEKAKKGRLSQKNADIKQRKLSEKMEEMRNEGFKLTGIVFVSFNDVHQVAYVRGKFKRNRIMDLLFKAKRILFLFYWGRIPFSKDNIEVKKAPEPTDIEWENLSYHVVNKLKRRFVISFIMYTIVAIDFFIILQINIQFKAWSWTGSDTVANAMNQFLNYISATIIVGLDIILEKICLYLNSWEMHYSKSNFSKSAATRIAFYTALNLVVPVLMANIGNAFYESLYPSLVGEKSNTSIPWAIYGNGGMISTMVFVFWFEAFKNFGLNLFDPFYYLKIAQQKKAIFTKGRGLKQSEAHEIFEGPGADMERRHGGLVASMILTTCYATSLPVALLFTLVSITLNYWSDKYIFLRRMVLPNSIGPQITNRSLQDLESIIILFVAGNVFFQNNVRPEVIDSNYQVQEIITNYTFRIMATIAILYKFVLPVDWINQVLFPVKKRFVAKENYDQARLKFLTDFAIENPVTRAQAIEELMELNIDMKSPQRNEQPYLKKLSGMSSPRELRVFSKGGSMKSIDGGPQNYAPL